MKKILFVVFLSLMGGVAFSQNSEITKAEMNFKKGILDKAKEHIDLAAAHEKTKDKDKTHILRGKVYTAIFLDSGQYQNLDPAAEVVAVESFRKAKELAGKKSTKVDSVVTAANNNTLNVGANAYKKADFKKATRYFKASTEFVPNDTLNLLYLGVAAQQAQDFPTAKAAYNKLLDLNYKKADVYINLIYIARNVDKDDNRALELIREAKVLFPNEKNLPQEELNILIATNKIEEAKQSLLDAINREPNNPVYYYNLGFMYDQTKETEKAIEYYNKALQIKPDYFEANFNLGVLHYNKAADLLKEVNAMDLTTYNKVGKKKEQEGVTKLKDALPYFEKAYSVNGDDLGVIETLETIYSRLNRTADANRMKKVLDEKDAAAKSKQ